MANDSYWTNKIDHIQNAERVDAGVSGRPDRQNEANARYLRQRIDAAELGEGVFAYDVTLDPDVNVGMPVYYSEINQRFEAGLAVVEEDEDSAVLVPSDSTYILGIVHSKQNSTLGTILRIGRSIVDMSAAITGTVEPGHYYLSSQTPGKLTKQRPPVSVYVATIDSNGYVYVNPQQRDFIEDHVHYAFDLSCFPAGEFTAIDAEEALGAEIVNADASIGGWLPADHAIFAGKAPEGAKFGYNLSQDAALSRVWPPVPTTSVYIERMVLGHAHRVTIGALGTTFTPALFEGVPTNVDRTTGTSPMVVVDRNGIWWMTNQARFLPWPWFLDFPLPVEPNDSSSSSSSSSSGGSNFAVYPDTLSRLRIYFTKMVFLTDRSVVTSLEPAEGSPIQVLGCDDDQPAKTGQLKLALDLELLSGDDDDDGVLAFKEIVDNQFTRGPVVSELIAGSNVTLTSTNSTTDGKYGSVTVDVAITPDSLEAAPDIIRLSDAVEDYYKETPHLALPYTRASSIRYAFQVPTAGLPADPVMKLQISILGRATGTLPLLTMTYRRIPAATSTPQDLPTSVDETSIAFPSNVSIDADEYVLVESATFDVVAGDTVLVTIAREDSDGYSGNVGLLRSRAVIVPDA